MKHALVGTLSVLQGSKNGSALYKREEFVCGLASSLYISVGLLRVVQILTPSET